MFPSPEIQCWKSNYIGDLLWSFIFIYSSNEDLIVLRLKVSTPAVLMLFKMMPDELFSLQIWLRMYNLKLTYLFLYLLLSSFLFCVSFTLFYRPWDFARIIIVPRNYRKPSLIGSFLSGSYISYSESAEPVILRNP